MAFEQIALEVKDSVATITLNRPEKLNAYTPQMGSEVHRAFFELDNDDAVRVIVVTGAGRAFCAGADLSSGGGTFDRSQRPPEPPAPAVRPWNMKKPIIAAINGAAVGVGITLPLQWDLRVAAESARIGFVFVRRGVIPEAISTWFLPRLIGVARANELLLSGRILTAREALEFGIISHVWPDAEFMTRTRELAADIAANTAPVSVAITKRLVYGLLAESEIEKAREADSRAFWWVGRQADAREGIASFLEKRKPDWKMKPLKDFPDFIPPVK